MLQALPMWTSITTKGDRQNPTCLTSGLWTSDTVVSVVEKYRARKSKRMNKIVDISEKEVRNYQQEVC